MNSTSFDLNKQDQGNEEATSESKKIPYESRELEIMKICEKLAASKFDKENVYKDIMNYLTQYNRWLYSVVSNYLFSLNEQDRSRYISNLDILLNYVDGLTIEEGTGIDIKSAIEKLWDHSNLAATQTTKLHNSDEEFFQRFQKNLIPFRSEFAHEMNMQFISLIAIFTALSFIVFGGITALDNIFNGMKNFPIFSLLILGSLWGLLICNLVFVFIFFISKLTKLSIKSSEAESASWGEKYPYIVWCNYIFLLILVLSCWGYYIDYSNSGTWVLKFSQEHEIFSFIIGFIVILFVFILLAIRILQRSQLNKANTEEITTKAIKLDEFSAQETVNLMNVYLQEWMHRDDLFWKQVFKFFYAILIVILLPQISNFIKVDISFIKNEAVFPIIGIVFSFLFLYIGLAYAYRLDASGKSYQKVMMLLKNEELMRISINDSRFFPNGKLFNPRISKMMVIVLFFLLFILSSILLLSGKL